MIIHQTVINLRVNKNFFLSFLKHFINYTSTGAERERNWKRVKYEIVDLPGYYYTQAAKKTDVWEITSNNLNDYVIEVSFWSEDALLLGKKVYAETSVFQLAFEYSCLSSLLTAGDVSQKMPQAARNDSRLYWPRLFLSRFVGSFETDSSSYEVGFSFFWRLNKYMVLNCNCEYANNSILMTLCD